MKLNRAQWTLILIFLLFIAPVFVAVLMNSQWWQYRPAGMTNLGTLVEPPEPLDYRQLVLASTQDSAEQSLTGRWVMLFPIGESCETSCIEVIESLRQVHRAAGRQQQALAILLVLPPGSDEALQSRLSAVYSRLLMAHDTSKAENALRRAGAEIGPDAALRTGQVFLVDPAGNIMMRYAAGYDPNHLREDLKRLLKWSGQNE